MPNTKHPTKKKKTHNIFVLVHRKQKEKSFEAVCSHDAIRVHSSDTWETAFRNLDSAGTGKAPKKVVTYVIIHAPPLCPLLWPLRSWHRVRIGQMPSRGTASLQSLATTIFALKMQTSWWTPHLFWWIPTCPSVHVVLWNTFHPIMTSLLVAVSGCCTFWCQNKFSDGRKLFDTAH